MQGPKYLVPQEITYRQVFKQSSDARKFRHVVFVELDFRDIGVQVSAPGSGSGM